MHREKISLVHLQSHDFLLQRDYLYVLVYMKGDVVDIAFNASFDVLGAVHVLERVVK